MSYPDFIRKAGKNEAGMYLTLERGLISNAYRYKQQLPIEKLVRGNVWMRYLFKPMANLLETSKIPLIALLGKQWNDHLTNQININTTILTEKGVGRDITMSGGVSTEELLTRYFKKSEWQMGNWFGLMYNVAPRRNSHGQT